MIERHRTVLIAERPRPDADLEDAIDRLVGSRGDQTIAAAMLDRSSGREVLAVTVDRIDVDRDAEIQPLYDALAASFEVVRVEDRSVADVAEPPRLT